MIRGMESVLLFSENAKKLATFYKEKVGLKITFEAAMDKDDDMFEFKMKSGSPLYIIHHSKVKGKNKQPERMMFNLEVDDIEKEVKRLVKTGVKKTQDIYHVEGYGYISTFSDLDGNYFQLVQVRAKK